VSITVEGDGSGAVLLFCVGNSFPRTFAVDIDFVGKRNFEIPNGEAVNNRADWEAFGMQTITNYRYHLTNSFCTYLHKVPAGQKASVKIHSIQAMVEDRETGLVNPTLVLNGVKKIVKGTVPYNHYLEYHKGESAKIYDSNWHHVKDLEVSGPDFVAKKGLNRFSIEASESNNTWYSSRIKVKDVENLICIPKPKS
jgi:hypothetical protein